MRNYNIGSVDHRIVQEIGTTEPVTLQEVKAYIRGKNTEEDTVLITPIMITSARKQAEKFLNRDIVSKQRITYYSHLTDPVNLIGAPILSIDSIVVDGGSPLVVNDDYELKGLDNPLLELTDTSAENVLVTYTTAGFAAEEVKMGVLALCANLYYGRTATVPTNWKSWLSPFKTYGYYGVR